MNTRAQLRYLPGGIVRAQAECSDAGLHLFVRPGDVPPPHRCYLPPEHDGRWHHCHCGCRWTLEGRVVHGLPESTPLLEEEAVSTRFVRGGIVRAPDSWFEAEPEPDVPPGPAIGADHPWLVWVGRGLAVAVLVVVVFGATGPW